MSAHDISQSRAVQETQWVWSNLKLWESFYIWGHEEMVEGIFIMILRPTARLSIERNDRTSAANSCFIYLGRKTSQRSHDVPMTSFLMLVSFFHCPRFPECYLLSKFIFYQLRLLYLFLSSTNCGMQIDWIFKIVYLCTIEWPGRSDCCVFLYLSLLRRLFTYPCLPRSLKLAPWCGVITVTLVVFVCVHSWIFSSQSSKSQGCNCLSWVRLNFMWEDRNGV